MTRNVSFDFFRGVMALMVCIGHFFYWNDRQTVSIAFILAVDFFLVLSGFVLAASLRARPLPVARFFAQRYLRLVPVYLACVGLTVPCVIWWRDISGPSTGDLVTVILMGQMLPWRAGSDFVEVEPLGIAWSISAELWAGVLLLPAAMALARRFAALAATLLVLLYLVTLAMIVAASRSFLDVHYAWILPSLAFGLVRCVMDYALGILTFMLVSRLPRPGPRLTSALELACIGAVLILYVPPDYDRRLDFIAPWLFAGLVLALAQRDGALYRLTSGRTGELLGDISYPLYLIHPLCIFLIVEVLGLPAGNLALLPYLALSLALAFAINRLVERPCMAWFKRKGGQVAPARPAVP